MLSFLEMPWQNYVKMNKIKKSAEYGLTEQNRYFIEHKIGDPSSIKLSTCYNIQWWKYVSE